MERSNLIAQAVKSRSASIGYKLLVGTAIEGGLSSEVMIALSEDEHLIVAREDILGTTPERGGVRGIFVRRNAEVWYSRKLKDLDQLQEKPWTRLDEENIEPPLLQVRAGDPAEGGSADQGLLKAGTTLEGTAKVFKLGCEGGGSFPNNCAHYLSNALIKAGFAELTHSHECVNARCNENNTCDLGAYLKHRVIRAKDLRCWFASKATTTSSNVSRGSGFWAVYQERAADSQGHVAIIDTSAWKYYGTGWFSEWAQEYYKW